METGLSELKELFELKDRDLRTYSPLTLAYIGDVSGFFKARRRGRSGNSSASLF